jgi:phosphoribosylamine--glycine ligase
VNLNTMINEDGVWPLEFTCRFGYPGFAVLEPLQELGWGNLFRTIIRPESSTFPAAPGFSLCVVLSTPPFPYSREEIAAPVGLPVIAEGLEQEHLHWGEVGQAESGMVTAGLYGWTAVVTGTGATISEAHQAAYARAARIRTPNIRYRLDIGEKLISGDFDRLVQWGWVEAADGT